MPAKKFSDQQIIDALERNGGIILQAAKALGTGRNTVADRISRTPSLKKEAARIREQNIDFAESKLMELIEKGQPAAIIFYLKFQAKERGYVERVEQTGKDGKDLRLPIVAPPRAKSMEEWLEQNRKEAKAA